MEQQARIDVLATPRGSLKILATVDAKRKGGPLKRGFRCWVKPVPAAGLHRGTAGCFPVPASESKPAASPRDTFLWKSHLCDFHSDLRQRLHLFKKGKMRRFRMWSHHSYTLPGCEHYQSAQSINYLHCKLLLFSTN